LSFRASSVNVTAVIEPLHIFNDVKQNHPCIPLYYESQVLEGSTIALVIAIGEDLLVAKLMRERKWPPSLSSEHQELEFSNKNSTCAQEEEQVVPLTSIS